MTNQRTKQAERNIARIENALAGITYTLGYDAPRPDLLDWGRVSELGYLAQLLEEAEKFYKGQPA